MAASILQSPAQICINKFSGIRYKGTTYDTFPRSIVTANNEIISAGGLYDYNNAGHIAKYSEKGNLLWSYTYTIDFYDFVKSIFFQTVHFTDIVSTADGGFIAAGNVEQVLSPFGLPPPVKKWALLSRIDKFGNVLWTKTLTSQGELSFTTIYQTADGDFIAYLATDNGKKQNPGDHSYGKILRLGTNGQIKWSTFLFTYLFDAGGLGVNNKRAITQASNHNIILADVVHNTSPTGEIKEGNLHFLELDYASGKLNWETSYEYPAPSSDTAYCPDIVNVKELPNGKFSFITTLYLPTNLGITFVKKGVNIITSNKGVVENMIAYTPSDRRLCRITDAAIDKNNGNRTLLFFKDDNSALLANIADDGQIVWKQGYNNSGGSYPVNCFSAGKNGYNIFMSNNHSLQFKLLITDATGTIDCENENADLIASPALLNYRYGDVLTDLSYHFDEYFDYAHPLKRTEEYPLIKTVDCQQTLACCTDIIDKNNVTNISICQGKSYMLPDSTVIQDSGLYYVTFKTLLGCDSVTFYKVKIDKDVSTLSIGNDTCLGGQRSLTLKATAGFDKYYWMNNFLPGNNSFSISQPGNYSVSVNNICGSKTDSIEIFEECDYKIYMPSAFTPNGNNKNDYFGISPFNKNKLINFSIYDRWGKLVFQTRNPAQTWDGTYKNEPMSAGAYIYYLEMIGLSGNKVSQKGYVMLIR